MAANQLLPFAQSGTAFVISQAAYAADADRTEGNQPGVARAELVNKAMRQSSLAAAAFGGFVAAYQATDVVDTLTPDQLRDLFVEALEAFLPQAVPTGVYHPYIGLTAPAGYVLGCGKTIGSASSGATERANADCQALYYLIYASMADAQAPVIGGRGASAAADWAANKPITVPDVRGRGLIGKDDMGGTPANRVTIAGSGLSGSTSGIAGGAQNHTLSVGEMPSHTHTDSGHVHGSAAQASNIAQIVAEGIVGVAALGSQTGTGQANIQNTGGGAAHPNMQPSLVAGSIIIKL